MIETLIFVAIIGVVLITLAGITATLLRQMRTNINKIYATHYAEELADWLRVQKDVVGWNAFYLRATNNNSSVTSGTLTRSFCVNAPISLVSTLVTLLPTNPAPALCAAYSGVTDLTTAPKIFKRSVTFTQDGCAVATPCNNARGVKARVLVEWLEAGGTRYQVDINTIYAPL